MGKGTIVSGGTDGQYQVQLNYDPDRKALAIQRLENQIIAIDLKIAEEIDEVKLGVYKLIKVSYQKKIDAINEHCTEDPTVSAWCADLTEDLSGVVGTIEVPGELGTVNIYPGFDGGALYATTQGQLGDNYLLPPAGSFYNLAMLPGWQKWKPTFRYATITALDGDVASIEYETTESSQQGLNINQTDSQDDVEIDYMDCNGAAFEVGDVVLVKFENQDWQSPKIIGFKDNPKPCGAQFVFIRDRSYCVVWDAEAGSPCTSVTNGAGDIVSDWPALWSDVAGWVNNKSHIGEELYNTHNVRQIAPSESVFLSEVNAIQAEPNFPHSYSVIGSLEGTLLDPEGMPENNPTLDFSDVYTYVHVPADDDAYIWDDYDNTWRTMTLDKYFPVAGASLVLPPKNISDVGSGLYQNDITIKENRRINQWDTAFALDETHNTVEAKYITPFGTIGEYEYDTLWKKGYYHGLGGMEFQDGVFFTYQTELCLYSSGMGSRSLYTENTIVQIHFLTGIKFKHTDYLDCVDVAILGDWICTGGLDPPPGGPIPIITYEDQADLEVHAACNAYADTSIIDPLQQERNSAFESMIKAIFQKSMENKGGPWEDKSYYPALQIFILK